MNGTQGGLLRRFFPIGELMNENNTDKELKYAVSFWNNMERKILGYKTPNELWNEETNYRATSKKCA